MGSEKSDFFTEIDTMKLVAEGNNPHVVNMIGCVTLQEPICLVTEFVKYGDLLSYLIIIRRLMMADQTNGTSGGARTSVSDRDSPMINSPTFPLTIPNTTGDVARAQNDWGNGACGACGEGSVDGDCSESGVLGDSGDSGACGACGEGEPLSPVSQCASYDRLNPYANLGEVEPVNLISFAYQIASGMEYLSSLGIIHRDLACRNILVGEEKQLKISDFGMARATVDEVYIKSSKGKLPWKWMAMESILTREFTTASDVWAFGVTLWEIATLGEFPYPTIANGDLLEYLRKGNRLEFPDDCSQDIYDIMLKCWDEMPEKRPTFSTLKTMFAEMLQESNSYIQLDNVSSRIPYYVNSHVLEELKTNGKKLKLEEERVNEERPLSSTSSSSSEHALSSAACTPPDYSDYELLKNSAVDAPPLEEQQQQDPPPVPPNLYVDTPTKRNERKGSSSTTLEVVEDQHHRHTRPSHLSLDLDAAAEETEV